MPIRLNFVAGTKSCRMIQLFDNLLSLVKLFVPSTYLCRTVVAIFFSTLQMRQNFIGRTKERFNTKPDLVTFFLTF